MVSVCIMVIRISLVGIHGDGVSVGIWPVITDSDKWGEEWYGVDHSL